MRITKSQSDKIKKSIAQHAKFKNAYFWTPPSNASGRRAMEERESMEMSFTNECNKYEYRCEVECSCRNVYYSGAFYLNGEKKSVRLFKNLIK